MFRSHVLKELSSYLDNQLPEKRRIKVESHLQACSGCRRELSRLQKLSEQLKAWQAPDLDLEFENRVKNKIVLGELEKGEEKMNKKLIPMLIPSSVLAAILLAVFLAGHVCVKKVQLAKLDHAGRYRVDRLSYSEKLKTGSESLRKESEDNYPGKSYIGNNLVPGSFSGSSVSVRNGVEERSEVMSFAKPLKSDWKIAKSVPEPITSPSVSGEGSLIVVSPVLPATAEGEKVIRNAQLILEVADGRGTYKKASEICQELGGYLSSSRFYKDNEGREAGIITMRIPKDKFSEAQDKLSTLGKVEDVTTDSQDVTRAYNNLKTQLDTSMIVYDKMLEALKKRQVTIPEAMRLESELTPIRAKIEELKNKIEYLDNAVSFATVYLNFHEPEVSAKALSESKSIIKDSMLAAGISGIKFLAGAIPIAMVIGVLALVVLVIVLLVKYLVNSFSKKG